MFKNNKIKQIRPCFACVRNCIIIFGSDKKNIMNDGNGVLEKIYIDLLRDLSNRR